MHNDSPALQIGTVLPKNDKFERQLIADVRTQLGPDPD